MIVLKQLSKAFGSGNDRIVAVDNVDLTVEKGQICGLVGHSGSGKSTLIRLLNGLERPDSGCIVVDGLDLSTATERQLRRARPKIGMIFQHFNLLWSRTVAQNIAFALQIAGADKARMAARVAELVKLVGLEGRESAYPAQLSGGQKQRVGIARALANHPEVLLSDEATSALDPETTRSILDLLLDVNRRLGLTILMITHELHAVRRICDSVAVMEAGRIVEAGAVRDVFARPDAATTKRLLQRTAQPDANGLSFDSGLAFDPSLAETGAGAVIRLAYAGPQARRPVLADAIQRFGLPINILHGHVAHTEASTTGELYVQVPARGEKLAVLLDYLRQRDIALQVIRPE